MERVLLIELSGVDKRRKLNEHILLYTGKFDHGLYGKFKIEAGDLEHAVKNFNAGIGTRFDENGAPMLPANYQHSGHDPDPEHAKASGWVHGLEIRDGKLFMQIEWTERAMEYIKNKEYRFISPEFHENWEDEEGKSHGFTVLGVALTNYNFLKKSQFAIGLTETDFRVIHDPENGKEQHMEELLKLLECKEDEALGKVKELIEKTKELTEQKTALEADLEAAKKTAEVKLTDKAEVSLTEAEYKELKDGINRGIEAEKKLAAMEARTEVEKELASDKPRFLPKQKEFFVKMYLRDREEYKAFLETAEPVLNMEVKGSGNEPVDDPAKAFDLAIKAIMKRDGVNYADAFKVAVKENSQLVEEYQKERSE